MKRRAHSLFRGISRTSRNIIKLCFLCVFSLSSLMIQAQDNQRISVDLREETLESVLWYLQNRTKFIFMYATEDIANITDISVRAKDKTITEILDECLEGTNLTYEISGSAIVIKKRKTDKITISGWIRDTSGEALPGATVSVRGSKQGAIAGLDGHYTFSIPAQEGLILTYSFIGMEKKTVKYTGKRTINVTLNNSSNTEIDEVVVTGYQNIQRRDLVGSITTVKAKDIIMPSYTTIDQMLQGRVAGMVVTNTSSRVGTAPKIQIRGTSTLLGNQDPLWVVDGIIQEDPLELDATSLMTNDLKNIIGNQISWLNPADIESISILKDASATAIYGARGANGVMIISTKGGDYNMKTKVNVSAENSFNIMSDFPEFVDGPRYMELYNEADLSRNPNKSKDQLLYSDRRIQLTRDGVNPYVYPNVDWQDVIFKKMTMTQRANINVSGGGTKVKYYMSLNVSHDSGLLNTEKAYSWNNNINIMNYTFQNNISYKLTPTTTIRMNMNAQIRQNKGPNINSADLFKMILTTTPVTFPATYPAQPGDTYIRYGSDYQSSDYLYPNPYAQMMTSYKEQNANTLNTVIKVEQDFGFVTKGLKANIWVNFKNWSSSSYNRSITPYLFRAVGYSEDSPLEYDLERIQEGADYIAQSDIARSSDQTFEFQGNISYNRQFGLHNVGGMLMYRQREYRSDVLPNRNQGVSGRFTYDYGQRYLAEINFGYNGTERLAKKKRFGFFPAMSLGWVISNEKFFEPLKNAVNNLKVRASYGLVGSDDLAQAGGSYYLYIDKLTDNKLDQIKWTFGESMNHTLGGPEIAYYANLDAVWEKAKKFDIGVDMTLFDHWNITIDYFYDKRYDIFMERQSWPNSLGYGKAKPWGNVGKMDNKGVEFSLNYHKNFSKDLGASFQANLTYNKNKLVYKDEPDYPTIWKSETGKPYSRLTGYISEGLFQSQEEIDNSPEQMVGNSTPKVGDIKYRDLNGDGKITEDDQCMISKYGSVPRLQYGFGGTVNYKKFDFGIFFSGSALRSILINGLDPFLEGNRIPNKNVLKFIADNHWSVDNPNPNAEYPRLGLTTGDIGNNTVNSTYWLRNGSFLRLKNLEIGYKIPYGRIYVSGANLLRFSPFDLWDPELSSWNSYPLQRTVNVGLQLNF